jgi:hypothetical protein
MADKPKAAKAPAKRGPTKAAALKSLGLTQEDLDAIKELRELREKVAATEAGEYQPTAEDVIQAIEAAGPMSEGIEDYPVQPTLGEEYEGLSEDRKLMKQGWSAAAPQAPAHVEAPAAEHDPVFYMRNLRGVEVAFRLSRQEDSKKRTVLKPRGSRGDLVKLSPEDLTDSELRTQVAYQLVEIIPEGEALRVIENQAINAQQPGVRPLEAMLTNSKGEMTGQMTVHTEPEFNSQGTVVAHLNPQENSPTGELPSRGKGIDWQAARAGTEGHPAGDPVAKGVGTPGIVQDGNPNRAAAARDAVARRRGGQEGPAAAGMEGMKVTVDAPVKT